MAFVVLTVSCMFGTFISETMYNDMDLIETFYKAINSLPTNMLTSFMSTQLTKWVIHCSHFYLIGGVLMIQQFRNATVRGTQLKIRCKPRSTTKGHIEWV